MADVSIAQGAPGKLAAKVSVASPLRSAEWSDMPLALRERAFFSSTVESARFLDEARDKLLDAVRMRREQVAGGEAFVDRSSFIGDLRKVAMAEKIGAGDSPTRITDLASRARLGLIYDMQTQSAFGYARWRNDQEADILDEFPAQELLPSTARVPREDWERRWIAAGGPDPINGRLVALKTDPVWEQLSRFGTPWPPFDFGSQRDLADIDRAEAERLGLIEPGATIAPKTEDFNAKLEASVADVSDDVLALLRQIFGQQVDIADGRVKWRGQPA